MTKETIPTKIEWQNGVGLAAKQLCSLVYISGLAPVRAKSLYIDPVLASFDQDITVDYDLSRRKVTVTSPSPYFATAEMRDGVGCTITTEVDKDSKLAEVELPEMQDRPLRKASPEDIKKNFDPNAVEAALNNAFSPGHNTLAVVILHKGELIAEKYAEGITSTTPLPGWSMAKSLTATLVGMLAKREKLDITQPGIVP